MARKALQEPDPIDLAAAAIASRVTVALANEIAVALRRIQLAPGSFGYRPVDTTAAERQRKSRATRKAAANGAQRQGG